MNHETENHQNTQPSITLDRMAMQASEMAEPDVPARILIAPWGKVTSSSGAFVLDEQAAHATLEKFKTHGADLPIDIEHQTLGGAYASPSGRAPAVGWIKALSIVTASDASNEGETRRPGLWADVEWTPEGRDLLAKKAYRYLSPVVLVRREDRRIAAVHSVALTNKPAIVGMRPVVNAATTGRTPNVAVNESLVALCEVLVMEATESLETILRAAADRIRTLQHEAAQSQAAKLVERAMSEGKLTAAQRPWAIELAKRDAAEFLRWADAAPQVTQLGRLSPQEGADSLVLANRSTVESSARAEYRQNREFLGKICTEEAYVAAANRSNTPLPERKG